MSGFIKKTFYIILTFFIGLFISSSFFIRAEYNYSAYGDNPILNKQNLSIFILSIVLMVLLSIVLYRLCLKLNIYSKKIVITVILVIFLCYSINYYISIYNITYS